MSVAGIVLSVLIGSVTAFVSDRYSAVTRGFFEVFGEFDQVVERGTGYYQLVPVGSLLNESIRADVEESLGTAAVPALFVPNEEELYSYRFNYLLGVPLQEIPVLWRGSGLSLGRWPNGPGEYLSGIRDDTPVGANRTIKGLNFTRAGQLATLGTFLDGVVVLDLDVLQALSNLEGKVTEYFVRRGDGDWEHRVASLEGRLPGVDVLTEAELAALHAELDENMDNFAQLFSSLAQVTALTFVFTVHVLNVLSRKKELSMLLAIGTPRRRVFSLLWVEAAILLLLGWGIGLPTTALVYVGLFTLIQYMVGFNVDLGFLFEHNWRTFVAQVRGGLLGSVTATVLGLGAVLAVVPSLLALRVRFLEELKER